MTFELTPAMIAAVGAAVSGAIAWVVNELRLRMNASDAKTEKEIAELRAENAALRRDNHDCEAKHTLTSIALAKVGAALEAMQQAMARCNQAECPLQAEPPKRTTTRIHPRPKAA